MLKYFTSQIFIVTQTSQLLKIPSVYQSASLSLIKAVTHLHVGVGRAGGIVDLPVQRDEYGFPCIYSSSLKGALRTALLWACLKDGKTAEQARLIIKALFGPEPEPEESFESSVSILDAKLLAMPVRSLKGVYAYVTAPLLLENLLDYCQLHEVNVVSELSKNVNGLLEKARELKAGEALCIGDKNQLSIEEFGGKIVLVEEEWIEVKETKNNSSLDKLGLVKLGLEKPLLVLHDDQAIHVINRSLLRLTRVRLNRATKSVEEGGLWSEEYVPAKTFFVSSLLFKKPYLSEGDIRSITSKDKEADRTVDDIDYLKALVKLGLFDSSSEIEEALNQNKLVEASKQIVEKVKSYVQRLLRDILKGYVIVGGHETIGRGIVQVEVIP